MEVNKLAKKNKVIRLDSHDIDAVYDLCRYNTLYYESMSLSLG